MKKKKPTSRPFSREEILRGMAAWHTTFQYQEQMQKTPEGRRSDDLRKEAQGLVRRGDSVGAHRLFLLAAEQHPASDHGAAAAACWFDLGMSFKDMRTGVRAQNLMEAVRLFRRAEEAPARRADVRRHILSLDGLGQVLRAIALELPGAESAHTEALQHLRKAVDLARTNGIATIDLLANALLNLGNVLAQFGKIDEAISTHEESIRIAEWIRREAPNMEELVTVGLQIPLRRMNLVAALVRRGRRADLQRAIKIIDDIISEHAPNIASRAHLVGYDIVRRLGGSHAGRAKDHLKRVDIQLLHPDEQLQYLRALAKEDAFERAITLARRCVAGAFQERHTAKADADADRCAAKAQRFSRLAAELLAGANRPVDAFLALEDTAALRYFDWISRYAWAPQTPLLRSLDKLHRRASELSVMLDDVALRTAGVDPTAHAEVLHQFFNEVLTRWRTQSSDFEWAGSIDQIEAVFTRAGASGIPGDVLRTHSHLLSRIAVSIEKEMTTIDPKLSEVRQTAWSGPASTAWLEEIFAEYPDVVLLRLSMDADNLLAIAVRRDNAKISGASATFPIPAGTINALFMLAVNALPESAERVQAKRMQEEKAQAQAVLNTFLATIDLSCVLPTAASHVILLPSLVASLVPWAASGPQERLLIDLVDTVLYLPNITPLLMRQAPWTRRSGTLVVVPGAAPKLPTKFHNLAFAETANAETRLFEAAATKEALRNHAISADIVSLFAHGHYSPDNPGAVRLADGDFTPNVYADEWRGMERVELWACRSGVNISYDPLTPWVDEAFGLDVLLHYLGVRSTIGTFWNVPDFVTALLVREYRRALSRGRNAPAALADAQRWWREVGLGQVRAALESEAPERHLQELAASLGVDAQHVDSLVTGMLGPVGEKLPPEQVDAQLREWASPTAWAGFRFLGVFERRPHGEAPPEQSRALTPDEHAIIEEILKRSQSAPNPDEEFECRLSAATTLGKESPSTTQAITAARLYATRRRSSQAHNLVRALAWVHEALAAPTLNDADRVQLQREAAWLWFELVICETPLALRHLRPIDAHLWGRATKAISLLPSGPDQAVLQLGLAVVSSGNHADATTLRAAWEKVRTEPGESLEGLRLRTLLVSLLLIGTEATPRQVVAELMNEFCTLQLGDDIALRWCARYAVVLARLLSRPGLDNLPIPSLPPAHYLPHALFIERCNLFARLVETHGDLPDGVMRDVVSDDLSLMEADFWGYRRDDGVPAWLATGSPGAGWQRFIGSLITQIFTLPKVQLEGARHFIASIHLGTDLRIAPLAATAVLHGLAAPEKRPANLSRLVLCRERHLNVLLDAAAIGDIASESDIFSYPRKHIDTVPIEPKHLTAWLAGETLDSWAQGHQGHSVNRSRTVAFDIERRLIEFDTAIIRMVSEFAKVMHEVRNTVDEQRFQALFDLALGPPRDNEVLERRLATLPPDVAVLGAFEGAQGELLLGAVWTENGQTKQTIHVARDASGARIALLLAEIQRVREEDIGTARGRSNVRVRVWADICKLLDEPLGEVLRGVGRRTLRVLAPHSLRGLPWLGLTAGGEPLHKRVRGVALLPFLGFEDLSALRRVSATPNMLCVLGGTPKHGETRFGAVVVRTLRRLFPSTVAGEPPTSPGTTITEVDLIESHDRDIQVLRFYGTGSPWALNASMEGITLAHDRILLLNNLDSMSLSACECVELWAATEGDGALSRQAAGRDALPSLVCGFLTAGAGGVVDLAWPVHDLVKALVCERFALLRRAPMRPPDALALAVSDIANLLADWKSTSASFDSVTDVLSWLDARRRENVRRVGLAPEAVAPFAPLAETVGPSPMALIETCCQPVHLAAFRWWGA